jgi:hypothetical protein
MAVYADDHMITLEHQVLALLQNWQASEWATIMVSMLCSLTAVAGLQWGDLEDGVDVQLGGAHGGEVLIHAALDHLTPEGAAAAVGEAGDEVQFGGAHGCDVLLHATFDYLTTDGAAAAGVEAAQHCE